MAITLSRPSQQLTSELTKLLYEDGPPQALSDTFKFPARRALATDVMISLRCALEILNRADQGVSRRKLRKMLRGVKNLDDFESVIAEFRRLSNETISIDKLKSSDPFSRPWTRSSATSVPVSIIRGKTSEDLSLELRKAVSSTLPLLTEIVSADSGPNLLNTSLVSTNALSQCSTKLMRYQMNKSLPGTSWTSCTSSPVAVTDADATAPKRPKKPQKERGVILLPATRKLRGKCRYPIKQGRRKGQPCGKNAREGESRCRDHMKCLLKEEEGLIRSVRFRVHATTRMQRVLPQWFGACRVLYNRCVNLDKNMDISPVELKKKLVSIEHPEQWMRDCPDHIRSEVIRDYDAARKSALALYEKKLFKFNKSYERWEQQGKKWKEPVKPKKPVMKHRTKKDVRSVITIPKDDIEMIERGFVLLFTKTIQKLCRDSPKIKRKRRQYSDLLSVNSRTKRKDKKYLEILKKGGPKRDVKLIRYRDGRLYMVVPLDHKIKDVPTPKVAVGIDPGLRTPLVTMGTDGSILEMGSGFKKNVKKHRERKSAIQKRLANLHGKKNKSRRKRLKKRMGRLDSKIINSRTQFHYEAAKELSSYQHVYLPEINYRAWNRGLPRASRRECQELAHPLFRNRLIDKSEVLGRGRTVHNCDEFMTTKTCSSCFRVHDQIKKNEIFSCPSCGVVVGRDHNAARNILLINLRP